MTGLSHQPAGQFSDKYKMLSIQAKCIDCAVDTSTIISSLDAIMTSITAIRCALFCYVLGLGKFYIRSAL